MSDASALALVFRSGECTCALGISHVLEVMRPLPVRKIDQAPRAVCGLSMIRGIPVPVVELSRLLTGAESKPARLILLRVGDRRVAIAVDSVLGIRHMGISPPDSLPPLMSKAAGKIVEELTTLDKDLVFLLNAGCIVPDGAWPTLPRQSP